MSGGYYKRRVETTRKKTTKNTRGDPMSEGIIIALISGSLTLLGVIISNSKSKAVTETKLDDLTREVREHNHFARRMPVLEEQIKVINHRIGDLEQYHK